MKRWGIGVVLLLSVPVFAQDELEAPDPRIETLTAQTEDLQLDLLVGRLDRIQIKENWLASERARLSLEREQWNRDAAALRDAISARRGCRFNLETRACQPAEDGDGQ